MPIAKKICDEFEDNELVQKAKENLDYFECLYLRYYDRLGDYAKRISSCSNESIEDILQESFINVYRNINEFDTSLKFSSWLYRIVHNVTISYWKKNKSGHETSELPEEDLSYEIDWDENIFDSNIIESPKRVFEYIHNLPEKYKDVIILKFMEGLSYNEISDVLKIPSGTVAVRINRAKTILKKLLRDSNDTK